MSQWYVELTCKRPKLLAYLTTTLQEPLCTVIAGSTDCYFINPGSHTALSPRKTSGYFLLSSEFDSLTDAGEVHSRAKTMLPFLNALVKLTIGEYTTPIDIDDVFRPDTQGRMIQEIMTATWTVNTLESKLQNAPGHPLNFTEIWHLMQKHTEVDEVLNYLANEMNWFNLYKAYEIIKKETHRLESSRTIRGGTFDRWTGGRKLDFEESANKERHSSFGYHPKPGVTIVYMSLDEAAEFVTKLFFQWSQTK